MHPFATLFMSAFDSVSGWAQTLHQFCDSVPKAPLNPATRNKGRHEIRAQRRDDTLYLRLDSNFKTAYTPGNLTRIPITAGHWLQQSWVGRLTALMQIGATQV